MHGQKPANVCLGLSCDWEASRTTPEQRRPGTEKETHSKASWKSHTGHVWSSHLEAVDPGVKFPGSARGSRIPTRA